MTIYWEDFDVGQTYELGEWHVTEQEIVAFAREFDPQPFHVDPDAAARGPFGGLIASGWHTAAMYMRMYVHVLLSRTISMGSPGIEELRWLAPVRPGDVLRGRVTILDKWPSSKRGDRGTLVARCEFVNQRDEVVMSFRPRGYFGKRDASGPPG